MRTQVEGAVDDQRTRILLDTGANVSIVSVRYAKKLGLRDIPNQDCSMDIRGISKEKATTTRKTTVKITLGWERVYVFDMWVIDHCAGVDVLLGTDFVIPAGVRLDMFHSNAKLPDEVSIPLIKTQAMKDEPELHYEVSGPSSTMNIPRREWMTFKVSKKHLSPRTHDVWIRRTESKVPTVTSYRKRWPYRIRLTNITILSSPFSDIGMCSASTSSARYSVKYTEWQVLAYAEARDKDLYKKEEKLYEQWLAT
ncbi:hypothetical protein PHMEG_00036488 [Phytophthora megakarya]|uniref:Peptidase A2 domain-containing protein n=1 Tax=Phytophthora megakarya TaxID=4795 RepID=A0A225ULG2_9STRA|nr:hypothetical protein PHMEG_00036488 [Phytophthora megakarya]